LSAVTLQPVITPVDRFGLTLCLAIIAHAIILLGVTFTPEDSLIPQFDTMEIILVQQKDPVPVEDAMKLAQANLQGGGQTTQDLTPATPLPPPFPDNLAELTAPPPVEASPPDPATETSLETKTEDEELPTQATDQLATESTTPETLPPEPEKQVVEEVSRQNEKKLKQTKAIKRPRLSAAALLRNSFKIAALSAEIKRKLEAKAKRPRRKFISASTREYKFAAYMEAWRAKVERIGNLNYPDEARKRKLSGSLILDVAINPDGSVNQITIRRSSGYKVLDDAAIRIVNLAAPFAPFPGDIRKDVDILHVTRTWQFINNRGFR